MPTPAAPPALPVHIDRETALASLEAVVDIYGPEHRYDLVAVDDDHSCCDEDCEEEHVIDECLYAYNGEIGCLIGAALITQFDVPLAVLYTYSVFNVETLLAETPVGQYVELDADALNVFTVAQKCQDGDRPWGEALRQAETGETIA